MLQSEYNQPSLLEPVNNNEEKSEHQVPNVLRGLQRALQCPNVILPLTLPRCLPCGHSFCTECISSIQRTTASPESICPMCRQRFPTRKSFPKNYSIIEYADSATGPYPRVSSVSAASQDAEDAKSKQPRMCAVHPHKKIKYFCLNCEEPICSKCFAFTHIRHVLEKPMNTRKNRTPPAQNRGRAEAAGNSAV